MPCLKSEVKGLKEKGDKLTNSTGYKMGIMKRSRAGCTISPSHVIYSMNFAQGGW